MVFGLLYVSATWWTPWERQQALWRYEWLILWKWKHSVLGFKWLYIDETTENELNFFFYFSSASKSQWILQTGNHSDYRLDYWVAKPKNKDVLLFCTKIKLLLKCIHDPRDRHWQSLYEHRKDNEAMSPRPPIIFFSPPLQHGHAFLSNLSTIRYHRLPYSVRSCRGRGEDELQWWEFPVDVSGIFLSFSPLWHTSSITMIVTRCHDDLFQRLPGWRADKKVRFI